MDVGIVHPALVWAYVDLNYETVPHFELEFDGCALANLVTVMDTHHKKRLSINSDFKCPLYHSKTLTDRLEHFYEEYAFILSSSKRNFIEMQPICGLTSVEQLIFCKYRHKSELVHPSSVHAHFKMTRKDYNKRKLEAEEIASKFKMTHNCRLEFDRLATEAKKNITSGERVHDVADAMLLLSYAVYKARKFALSSTHKKKKKKTNTCPIPQNEEITTFFEQFRYKNPM